MHVTATIILLVALGKMAACSAESPAEDIHPFDGVWTVKFSLSTAPGGASMSATTGNYSPYNLHFVADSAALRVDSEGVINWKGADRGELQINAVYHLDGQPPFSWSETHQPLLKVAGQASAIPNPPAATEPYMRHLDIALQWSGGDGLWYSGGSGTYHVEDGETQMVVTGPAASYSVPIEYYSSSFQLKPTVYVIEEAGQDVLIERVTYSASRRSTFTTKVGSVPVVEQIEIQHVRHLNLVPRDDQ